MIRSSAVGRGGATVGRGRHQRQRVAEITERRQGLLFSTRPLWVRLAEPPAAPPFRHCSRNQLQAAGRDGLRRQAAPRRQRPACRSDRSLLFGGKIHRSERSQNFPNGGGPGRQDPKTTYSIPNFVPSDLSHFVLGI